MAQLPRLAANPPWPALLAAVLACVWSSWIAATSALEIDICSSLNTGTTNRNISIYQSLGLCHDFCIVDNYAFAVVNWQSCWCSNNQPAESTEVDDSGCDEDCPGYPDESCGSKKKELYGYVSLAVLPSSTVGPSTVGPSTVGASVDGTSALSTTPPTSLTTITDSGGSVRTVTATPAVPTDPSGSSFGPGADGNALSTGQIVGVVVGVIAGIAVIATTAICLAITRRRRRDEGEDGGGSTHRSSSATMMRNPAVMGNGLNGGFVSAWAKNNGAMAAAGPSRTEVDPRMDPSKGGLYARSMTNDSLTSLRDEHDYSRRIQAPKVLRATNPDPDVGD